MTYDSDAEGLPEQQGKSEPARSSDGISGVMAGWFGVALTILALVALIFISRTSGPDSLGYSALAGTAVLSIGLISLIVLSRAVGIIEPTAALGLPRGSVRALLALGLAIVFVAVASWTLGGLFNPIGPLVTKATVQNKEERDSYWARYPATGYIVREIPSQKAKPTARATSSGDTAAKGVPDTAKAVSDAASKDANNDAAYPKDLEVYLKGSTDQGVLDLAKQILTISATVLVTIVGFYFGSKASADAALTVGAIMSGSTAGLSGRGAQTTPATADDLEKLSSGISAISAECAGKLKGLGADPMALLGEAVSGSTADADLTRKLQAVQRLYADLQAKSAACDVDATRAKETVTGLPSSPTQPQIQQAGERLKQLKADAEQSSREFYQTLTQYSEARQFILQKTAKG
jgi:hypothetical protein